MFSWKIINEEYISFLRTKYENRIPLTNYGDNKMKPFFGNLFEVNDLVYVTQVSSSKPRHINLKENLDFHKIIDENNRLLSVINLNFMFPVPKQELIDLKYKDIDKYINFTDVKSKSKYISLLKKRTFYY